MTLKMRMVVVNFESMKTLGFILISTLLMLRLIPVIEKVMVVVMTLRMGMVMVMSVEESQFYSGLYPVDAGTDSDG